MLDKFVMIAAAFAWISFESALMNAGLVIAIAMDYKVKSRLAILFEFMSISVSASIMFAEFIPMPKVF